METKKTRDANLELLRIIAMMLIITLHSLEYGGAFEALLENTINYYLTYFLYGTTQIAVNCYVMISGYFLVTSKFKLKKLVSLWLEVVFYSLFIYLILAVLGLTSFGVGTLITCFIPILSGRYWFVTIYVGMYLVSPFINKAVYALSREQHRNLNILLFFLFSVWILLPFSAGMNSGGGWGLAWFVVLYFQASYLRLYYKPDGKIGKKALAAGLNLCLIFFTRIGMELLGKFSGNSYFIERAGWCYRYDSLPVFLATMSVFILLINVKTCVKIQKSVINAISPLTFAIYLIHHHARLYPIIWEIIGLADYAEKGIFIPYLLCSVLVVFLISAAIAYVGSTLLKIPEKLGLTNMLTNTLKEVIMMVVAGVRKVWKGIYGETV